jgi:peptidyl-prolyl cis-trans isomerase C
VLMRVFNEKVEELMSDVKIEVTDPALKAAMDAQDAAQNNAEGEAAQQ